MSPVPVFNIARCSGCGRCVASCLVKIITLEVTGYHKNAVIKPEGCCTVCGRCVESCPVGACD